MLWFHRQFVNVTLKRGMAFDSGIASTGNALMTGLCPLASADASRHKPERNQHVAPLPKHVRQNYEGPQSQHRNYQHTPYHRVKIYKYSKLT